MTETLTIPMTEDPEEYRLWRIQITRRLNTLINESATADKVVCSGGEVVVNGDEIVYSL